MQGLNPAQHALMEMLSAGGTLMILFFTVAFLGFRDDLLGTRLGKVVLGFIGILYVSRAAEELLIAPVFSPLIFTVCLATGLLYFGLLALPGVQHTAAEPVPEVAA